MYSRSRGHRKTRVKRHSPTWFKLKLNSHNSTYHEFDAYLVSTFGYQSINVRVSSTVLGKSVSPWRKTLRSSSAAARATTAMNDSPTFLT